MTGVDDVLAQLRARADPARLPAMARYGIATEHAYGVTVAELRTIARGLRPDHALAGALWESGVPEARILASMVDDRAMVDDDQLERWASGFDSWDLCDQVCQNLFRHTAGAWGKTVAWIRRPEPFVKRAGFSLIAGLAVADKKAGDERFAALLGPLAEAADDDRPLVRKGASWALRAIGKHSPGLHPLAVDVALALRANGGRGARWVGTDVLRELQDPRVAARMAAEDAGPPDRSGAASGGGAPTRGR
jgi:3-methyladenine DNA glycosylase AlkD